MNANGSNQLAVTQTTTLDWGASPNGRQRTTSRSPAMQPVGQPNTGEIFFINAEQSNITNHYQFFRRTRSILATARYHAGPTPSPTPTPIPSPSPSFTISGDVTDGNGQGLADVTMMMLSDVTGTQITFTDQSGNYVFNYAGGVSHSLNVTPSKSGFVFNPLSTIFISSSSLSDNNGVVRRHTKLGAAVGNASLADAGKFAAGAGSGSLSR